MLVVRSAAMAVLFALLMASVVTGQMWDTTTAGTWPNAEPSPEPAHTNGPPHHSSSWPDAEPWTSHTSGPHPTSWPVHHTTHHGTPQWPTQTARPWTTRPPVQWASPTTHWQHSTTTAWWTNYTTTPQIPTTIANLHQDCGTEPAELDNAPGQIRSPNYPNNYDNNEVCQYRITVPQGKTVLVRFDDIQLEGMEMHMEDFGLDVSTLCKYDYVAFYDGADDTGILLAKICGDFFRNVGGLNFTHIQSIGNQMFIKFVSDSSNTFRGFQLTYLEDSPECGGTLNGKTSGIVTSTKAENWVFDMMGIGSPMGNVYENNLRCEWFISVESGLQIQVDFYEFEMEKCDNFDYLEIGDGLVRDENGPSTVKMCGATLPEPFESSGNNLYMYMKTDESVQRKGFRARYSAINKNPNCGSQLTAANGSIDFPGAGEGDYDANKNCEWTITVDQGDHVVLSFLDFGLEDSQDCSKDYLEIRNGGFLGSPLLWTGCGERTNIPEIASHSYKVYIRFKSDGDVQSRGFRLQYRSETGCGANLTAPFGIVQSPNYPDQFPDNMDCLWALQLPMGQNLKIVFDDLDIGNQYGYYCYESYVQLQSGMSQYHHSSGNYSRYPYDYPVYYGQRYCGTQIPAVIHESTSLGIAQFKSNNHTQGRGFQFSYEIDCNTALYGRSGSLASPMYPDAYPKDASCSWTVHTNDNGITTVDITSIQLPDCNTQSLQIIDSSGTVIGSFCGQSTPSELTIYTSSFTVRYFSGASQQEEGFHLNWNTRKCSFNYTEMSGSFQSPMFPALMPPGIRCEWIIQPGAGNQVTLSFADLELTHCYSLRIYTGWRSSYSTFCGNDTVFTSTSTIRIVKEAEWYENSNTRFSASFETTCGGVLNADRSGQLVSPGGMNGPYRTPQDCTWVLKTNSASQHVFFRLHSLDIGMSQDCVTGSLTIRESNGTSSPWVMCDDELPRYAQIPFSGPELTITFAVADGSIGTGFRGSFYTSRPSCDRILFDETGILTSLNYPERPPRYSYCTWTIVAPFGQRVRLTFDDVNLRPNNNDMDSGRCYNGPYIRTMEASWFWNRYGTSFPNLCMGSLSEDVVYVSSANELKVSFSGGSRDYDYTGFHATYEFVEGCGGILSGQSGSFGLPSNFSGMDTCIWTIEVEEGKAIQLQITDYDNPEGCDSGLGVYTGHPNPMRGNSLLTPNCHQAHFPEIVRSENNTMYVLYRNLRAMSRFSATYQQIDQESLCGGEFSGQAGVFQAPEMCSASHLDYLITVSEGSTVTLELKNVIVTYSNVPTRVKRQAGGNDTDCDIKLVIYDGPNTASPVLRSYCNSRYVYRARARSSSNQMMIRSSGVHGRYSFVGSYQEECFHMINASEGHITSGNYPGFYGSNTQCLWVIMVPSNFKVALTFHDFELAQSEGSVCGNRSADSVELYNSYWTYYNHWNDYSSMGSSIPGSRFATLCGTDGTSPAVYTSDASTVVVKMSAYDNGNNARGFNMSFRGVCHSVLRAQTDTRYLSSYRRTNGECSWTIVPTTSSTGAIAVTFRNLSLPVSPNCARDYVEIRTDQTSTRYCGTSMPPVIYSSIGNNVTVIYHLAANSNRTSRPSFSLMYNMEQQPLRLTTTSGTFHSKNFPSDYPNGHNNEWKIQVAPGSTISLSFPQFRLEPHISCGWDYVAIYDGPSRSSSRMAKLCGTVSSSRVFESSGNEMTVYFRTDHSITAKGFEAEYIAVSPPQRVELTGSGGTITVEGNQTYNWVYTAPAGQAIRLDIQNYENAHTSRCNSSLQVFEGNGTFGTRLTPPCYNREFPAFIVSSSSQVFITYSSESSHDFTIDYVALSMSDLCAAGYTGTAGVFSTPPAGFSCANAGWTITVPEGNIIQLQMLGDPSPLELLMPMLNSTSMSVPLTFYNGPDATSPEIGIMELINNGRTPGRQLHIVPANNTLQAPFTVGFNATCFLSVSGLSGYIESPGYPSNYGNNLDCNWRINVPSGMEIVLTFEEFDLDSASCPSNSQVDQVQVNSPYRRYCGSTVPPPYEAHANEMNVKMITNSSGVSSGFKARYEAKCRHEGDISVSVYSRGSLSSPNYPRSYPDNLDCAWNISTSNSGRIVQLTFNHIYLPNSQGNCSSDYLEVTQSDGVATRFCGNTTPSPVRATGEWLGLVFHTDGSSQASGLRSGFNVIYASFEPPCWTELTEPTGVITSPGYPGNYGNNENCTWLITAPVGQRVQLTFTEFKLESQSRCRFDVVKVYDGQSLSSTKLTETYGLCGNRLTLPKNYTSTGRRMLVHFRSDYSVQERGFKANYSFLD